MAGICNTYVRNNETEKYVKRVKNAGKILDPFSVVDIDNFIGGCKDLGVWNSMVCWPLRSTQNTETNTALSLGGLGTYDGTLVNGPTWGMSGVNFNIINSAITASGAFNQPLTVMGAVDFKTTFNGGCLIDGSNRVTLFNGGEIAKVTLFAGQYGLDSGGNVYNIGKNFIGGYANGSSSSVHLNGTTTFGDPGTSNLGGNQIIIGNNFVFNFGDRNIDIAFCAIFSGQPYIDAVRTLYKTTLGKGLGLP